MSRRPFLALPLRLDGHIGDAASALVDGQLRPEDEERAWAHVLGCPGCRGLVEQEGWTKQRLAGLARPPATTAVPPRLAAVLGSMPAGDDADAWAQVRRLERRSRARRAALALVGAGSVGVAAAAVLALAGPLAPDAPDPADRGPAWIGPDVVRSAFEGALQPASVPGPPPGSPAPGPVADRVAR